MRIDLSAEESDAPFRHTAHHHSPEIVGAAGAFGAAVYRHSRLSLRELEAARYRTAQINGCQTCMSFRGERDLPHVITAMGEDLADTAHSRGAAPDDALYDNIEDWRTHPGLTERERLAIWYAEGLGIAPRDIAEDEQFWTRAKAAFSDAEIVDLTYSICSWIANGRAMHALGLDRACFIAGRN